jgi:hypothetical protein
MFIHRHLSWRRIGIGCVLSFRNWFDIYMTLSMCVLRATSRGCRYLFHPKRPSWRLLSGGTECGNRAGVCIAARYGTMLIVEPEAFLTSASY